MAGRNTSEAGRRKKGERLAFEEMGLIEIVTLVFIGWLFLSGHYTAAIVVAFFMGVGAAYLFDTHMSRIRNADEYSYVRKHGARSIMEEFGIAEIALFALSAASYYRGIWMLSAAFSLALGIVVTYSIDRIRRMRAKGGGPTS